MKPALDFKIHQLLEEKLLELELHFNADILTYYGAFDGGENVLLRIIEELTADENKKDKIYIILTTGGGSATVVERLVNILRHHYQEVNFIVPDFAYSAGTIFCMSGDNILMDYFSVLGPIDPQVRNKENKMVPALGYLDKINELIEKAQNNELSNAEFIILKDFDLAELRSYQQAKDLTIDLLEKWLVKYKFKNWSEHRTNPDKLGQPVTEEEKIQRAKEIGDALSDNKIWKFHGRPINIEALKALRLEIDDYSNLPERRKLIRDYYELVSDYVTSKNYGIFVQTRKFI
ncbi:SDH family Clp fold serine proteinase [Elizabethkingia anophelis]|uniref:SDH family Clp fold serine proteinase n=1 Tax=Elizabethkingia anophelis TaxID=1117645 RepID=UPI001EE6FA5D|nr:serine dehydrogenasease [Elizabethkingia anophelis]UKY84522.1 serine dehydrogenasease [Elizabethkingia anophelis]